MYEKYLFYLYILMFPLNSHNLIDSNCSEIYYKYIMKRKQSNNSKNEFEKIIIDELNGKIHVYNYDELDLTINKFSQFFFNKTQNSSDEINCYSCRYCYNLIQELTNAFITLRDGKISYKYWENQTEEKLLGIKSNENKIHVFNHLSRLLPNDILITNFLVKNNIDIQGLNGVYFNINIADKLLENVLKKGVAENHVHLGASHNFAIIWRDMMQIVFKSNNHKISNDIKLYEEYIYAASVKRIILMKYLSARFDLQTVPEIKKNNFSFDNANEIIDKNLSYYFAKNDEYSLDKISILFSAEDKSIKTYSENIFLYKALRHLKDYDEQWSKEDRYNYRTFFDCFMDYLRIKNFIYTKITQFGQIKGLDFFQKHYHKASSDYIDKAPNEYWEELLRSNFQNPYLKKFEGRLGIPKNGLDKIQKKINDILIAYSKIIEKDYKDGERDFPKLGLIFHFIKEKDIDYSKKCWKLHDSQKEWTDFRVHYLEIQKKYQAQLNDLLKIRNKEPIYSYFILGIDAASLENNTPISVFAPIFRKARDSSLDNIIFKINKDTYLPFKSLCFTFHAGEEFRHVLSGLRRIYEVVKHCKFRAGDRIGHAIALGVNVRHWAKKNPVIIIPRIEYLENLLWIWEVYSYIGNENNEVSIYLERQILLYAKEIYGNIQGMTVSMLCDAYQKTFDLFDDSLMNKFQNENIFDENSEIFCCRESKNNTLFWTTEKIVLSNNCCCYRKNMEEAIFIEISEIDKYIMETIQRYCKGYISNMGIVIESNPTSNLVIGQMDSLTEHPLFKFVDQSTNEQSGGLLININSDDPAVFNTNTNNELAYIYYTCISNGISRKDSLDLLDYLRESGINTSFISQDINNKEYLELLKEIVKGSD